MILVTIPKVRHAIYNYLDEHLEQHERIGELLARVHMNTSQVRNLQQIVYTATRFTTIINYVKNQIGKGQRDKQWATVVNNNDRVGDLVLQQLDQLRHEGERIAQEYDESPYAVALQLARGWVEQVATQFLYCRMQGVTSNARSAR